jgi:hypothetical protein
MKRMMQISFAVLFLSLAFFAVATAQEKKNENRIKVVIADKSGEKVIIDTVFSGEPSEGKFVTKDGKVIIIGGSQDKKFEFTDNDGDKLKTITVIADGGKDGEKTREIKIVKGDSLKMISEDGKVIVVEGKPLKIIEGKHIDIKEGDNDMVWVSAGDGSSEKRVMVYSTSGSVKTDIEKDIRVKVVAGEKIGETQSVNLVIAKDGMVVSIEGNDEARAKELADLIEKHLEGSADAEKKTVKEEVKKNKK